MKILRPSVMRQGEWFNDHDQAQWKRIQTQVLNRDRFTCTYCRYYGRSFMQVNHISAEDTYEPGNLETVCRACHSVLHLGINCMNDTMSVFECKPEVSNIAPLVCATRSLVAKKIPWSAIEQQILEQFGLPNGKHYDSLQSTAWAKTLLQTIAPSDFRACLPEGLAILFHEEGEWKGFPEITWKWQVTPGSGYREAQESQ